MLRVLVLSRNLTFDKSWDIALVLEGMLQPDRSSSVQRNARLAQFLRKLPALAAASKAQTKAAILQRKTTIDLLAQDVLKTEFDCPPEFEELVFWPLGIGESEPPTLFRAQHSRNPQRLDRIGRLMNDLKTGGALPGVIPADFEEIWKAFRPGGQ